MLTPITDYRRTTRTRSAGNRSTRNPGRLCRRSFAAFASFLAGQKAPSGREPDTSGSNRLWKNLFFRRARSAGMTTFVVCTLSAMIICCGATRGNAQNLRGVEPIVLTTSPPVCDSPAALASQRVALPCVQYSYRPGTNRICADPVSSCSQLQPLPPQQWSRGYASCSRSIVPSSGPVTVYRLNNSGVCVPLPPVVPSSAPRALPQGYVVGSGLLGQPKLYKPGQPIRNFLRFLTL